jgi:SPP1 gp7 family putative phage head morphogenesis protein
MPSIIKADPSKTGDIRRAFLIDMRRRFNLLKKDLVAYLRTSTVLEHSVDNPFVTNANGYEFKTRADRIDAHNRWLQKQIEAHLLVADDVFKKEPWTAKYVTSAYQRGVTRSYVDMQNALGRDMNKPEAFYNGSKAQFLRDAFNQPVSVEKLQTLNTRDFSRLKGITDSMGAEISGALADGLAHGYGAAKIMRNMVARVDVSRDRAERLARTEIISVHAEGQLDGFEKQGAKLVGMQAEVLTAGDDKVCPVCTNAAKELYTIKEARGIIPLHPNCRCCWTPANIGEKRGKLKGKRKPLLKTNPVISAPAAGLWGHQPTAVLRWMGQDGWSAEDAQRAMQASGVEVSLPTIKTQLGAGRTGQRGDPAKLTNDQIIELNRRRQASTPTTPPPVLSTTSAPRVPTTRPPVVPPLNTTNPPIFTTTTPAPVVVPPLVTGKPEFTQSSTAIARALGQKGYSFDEARKAIDAAGLSMTDATLRTQLGAGRKGQRGDPATLTDQQWAFIEHARTGKAILPTVATTTTAPKPSVTKPSWLTFEGKPDEFTERVWKALGEERSKDPDTYRSVGKLVLEEVNRHPLLKNTLTKVATLKADTITLYDKWDEAGINKRLLTDTTSSAYDVAYKKWRDAEAAYNKAIDEYTAAKSSVDIARKQVIVDTLKRVRDMGNGKLNLDASGSLQADAEVTTAATKLPTDWINGVGKVSIVTKEADRGYFSARTVVIENGNVKRDSNGNFVWDQSVIALSGDKTNKVYRAGVAVHELVHACESYYHGGESLYMGRVQRNYLMSRRKPNESLTHIAGDDADSVGYKDEFKEHYIGRDYGSDSNFEIMTMGVEGVLESRRDTFDDLDLAHFVLGMLAGF